MDSQPYSYVVRVGGREYSVQVIPLDSSRFRVLVEGSEIEVVVGGRQELVSVPTTSKASNSTPAEVDKPTGSSTSVGSSAVPKAPTPAPPPQAPQQPTQLATALVAPGAAVEAPIPGKVLKVLVNIGDTVSPGQLVATLESMKMEVQVFSSRSGRVKEIRVRPGDFINVGDPILILE